MTKHQILVGPYRSGKSWILLEQAIKHCLNRARDKSNSFLHNETVIIVPSQRYRSLIEKRLQQLLASDELKTAGLWGLKILTFYQFCQINLLKAGSFGKELPDAGRAPLISIICEQLLAQGKINKLKPIINSPGTQTAILDLIDEWQRGGYKSAQVTKSVERIKQEDMHLYIELSQIYSAYDQALQDLNYIDHHGLVFKLIELLNTQNKINWLSDFIVVDGFDRLNKLQMNLLAALAKHVPQLHISFDYKEPSYQKNSETKGGEAANWKHSSDMPEGAVAMKREDVRLSEAKAALYDEYLWKERTYSQMQELFGDTFDFENVPERAAQAEKKTIDFFAAADRLAEMSVISAHVKEAIMVNKIRPNEIVVTARNLKSYRSAIEATFQDAGLDYHIDESVSIQTLPIIHFLVTLLSLAIEDFPRRQVIDCLRSPYFNRAAFQLTAKDIEELNFISLESQIVSGQVQWQAALKNNQHLAKAINNIFSGLIDSQAKSQTINSNSALNYAKWVEDIMDQMLDLSTINDELDPYIAWKQNEAIVQFRRALANLIQQETLIDKVILNQLSKNKQDNTKNKQALYQQNKDNQYFYERLCKLIEKANFSTLKPTTSKVLVTSAELVPNEKFKQIYLAGMLEGEFPQLKSNSGFLTQEELAQWQRFGIDIYNPRLEAGFEYALFASLINRAEEKIVLSYPNADIISSKEEPVPSFFLTGLNIIPQEKLSQSISFDEAERSLNSARNTFTYCIWHDHNLKNLEKTFKNNPELAHFIDQLEDKLSFATSRASQFALSPLNGYLVDLVAAQTIKINMPAYWSASQLNDYGKCPFNFWLTRILRVEPHAEPEAGLDILTRGNFYHKVLELFYSEIIAKKLSLAAQDDAPIQTIFSQAIDAAIIWLEKQYWFHPTEFWQEEKKSLVFRLQNFYTAERKRALQNYLESDIQYAPYLVEAEFGPGKANGPLVIKHGEQQVELVGKIDRIDVELNKNENQQNTSVNTNNAKYVRLVDYKTGSTWISDDDFSAGRNIQLPLYALAIEQSILPGSKVIDYSYLSISSGKNLSRKKQGQDIEAELDLLQNNIFKFIANIQKGDFSIKPSADKVCQTCLHFKVCRINEFPQTTNTVNSEQEGQL